MCMCDYLPCSDAVVPIDRWIRFRLENIFVYPNKISVPPAKILLFVLAGLGFAAVLVLSLSTLVAPKAAAACPTFQPPQQMGTLDNAALKEVSGMAASRRHPGVLYVHNDGSEAGTLVYAITEQGDTLATYQLADVEPEDVEAIAVGPGPEQGMHYLYLGDIGSNEGRSSVEIYRVPEPEAQHQMKTQRVKDVTTLRLEYPDGKYDAEALMVDSNQDLYIVTKNGKTGESRVYRKAAAADSTELEHVATLNFGQGLLGESKAVTGGDISAQGTEAVLRTYHSAFLWRRAQGKTWAATFADPLALCSVPTAPLEWDGYEAIAFDHTGMHYYDTYEERSSGAPVNRYDRSE